RIQEHSRNHDPPPAGIRMREPVSAKPAASRLVHLIGIAVLSSWAFSTAASAQAPAFATYLGSERNDSVIAMDTDAAGAVYVLSYDGIECVLSKLAPNGPLWVNAYSYPIGPASCNAMAVAPNG